MTCKVGKQIRGRVKVTCRVVPPAARATASSIRATMTRYGRVYARGASPANRTAKAVTLTSRQRLTRGVYRMRFVVRHVGGTRSTIATTLRIRA